MSVKWLILTTMILIYQITNVYSENNKIYFIVNPAAGNNSCGEKFNRAESRYLHNVRYSVHPTEENKSATTVVEELLTGRQLKPHCGDFAGAPTLVVAVGGDATYAQVAKALREKQGFVIGILPFGTGNDTARGLGIPVNNTRQAIDILTKGEPVKIGAYKLVFTQASDQEEWAFQEIDVGMSEEVGRRKADISGSGCFPCRCFRELTYTRLAIQAKWNWTPEALGVYQDQSVLIDAPALFIALTTTGYFGGGYNITPQAGTDNGQLVFIHAISNWQFLRFMPVVKRGEHIGMQNRCYQAVMSDGDPALTIKRVGGADETRRMRVQIDGEPREYELPVDIAWHRNQVSVMAPKKEV